MQCFGGAIMKNLRKIMLSIALVCMTILCGLPVRLNKSANALAYTYSDYVNDAQQILKGFCDFKERVAGSSVEGDAAAFIHKELKDNATMLTPKEDVSSKEGVQTFQFFNQYTGTYNTSQNIIFEFKASSETKKKVILACNYDAPYKYDYDNEKYSSYKTDAVNTSAGSVVALLMLARTLPTLNIDFNLEFVFFGAGEVSCSGSEFYLNGVSNEEAKNILCMINLDKIAVGKNSYFYIDEIQTGFSKYVSDVVSRFASEVNLVHLNKSELVDSKLNLGYSHIALDSDNVNFMSRGIASINFFAGEYDNGLVLGLNEYEGKAPVSYTENDTLDYINKTYGESVIFDNLYKFNMAIETLLTDIDFQSAVSETYNQNAWFYAIFANENLVIYLTFVAFVVMLIISMYIYYKLTVKSYYANIETEFLTSVVKIADQIDHGGEDKDVAKIIGQVIANDIKKDKTLKREKKRKDKKDSK